MSWTHSYTTFLNSIGLSLYITHPQCSTFYSAHNYYMIWPHLFRYKFKKWLDHYEFLRRVQENINNRLCKGKLPEFKKPVSSQCFEVYLISFAPLYRIIFVLCSLLALATSGYFYCCCVLYVFLKSNVLHQVLTIVRRSGRSPKIHVHIHNDTCTCTQWYIHTVL